MSSEVSLVPTDQKPTKKRRPTFRPGVGPRKKVTKPPTTKKNEQPEPSKADGENVQVYVKKHVSFEGPLKEVDGDAVFVPGLPKLDLFDLELEREQDAERKMSRIESEREGGKDLGLVEMEKRLGVEHDETRISANKGIVKPAAPESSSEKNETLQELPPQAESRLKGRSVRRQKVTVSSSRQAQKPPKPHSKSKKKDEHNPAPALSSLSTYCTKFRATPRSNPKNAPPPPPPPPVEEEEEALPAGPQVKIVDGEIVLHESSMVVPNARKTVQEVEEEFQDVVEEEGHTTIVGASYNSFVERRKPQHWSVEETKLFYHCLRQVGTDFVTMEAFFTTRTRKQLKKKFQQENVKNSQLIEMSLDPRNKLPIDLSVFNVDKDSIVVTRRDQDPIVLPYAVQEPPPPEPVTLESSSPQPLKNTTVKEVHDDIFSDWPEEAVEEFTMETEMAIEKEAVIPLAPTTSKAKTKRPKFRAGKRKK